MVANVCNPRYLGGGDRRIVFEASLGDIVIPCLKKLKELGIYLSGGVLDYLAYTRH